MYKQYLFALLIVLYTPIKPHATENRIVDTSDFKMFINGQLTLRPLINNAAYFYLNNDDESFFYFKDDRRFLYRKKQQVLIKSIHFGQYKKSSTSPYDNRSQNIDFLSLLTVTYDCDVLGKQTLILNAGSKEFISQNTFTDFINKAFILDSSSDLFQAYAVNQNNGIVHSSLSNHILSTEHYQMKNDLSKVDSTLLCSSCFIDLQKIDDMAFELYIGRQATNYFLSYNRVITNDSLLRFLDSLGLTILESWPLPKKGYNYEFYLVDNMSINALACPGGVIFINMVY